MANFNFQKPEATSTTRLSLVQREEEVCVVADGVHQDAVLDRPEVQLYVQSASAAAAAARGRPVDLVGEQPLLEVVSRLDGAEALGGRPHAVRLGEEVRLPPADRQVAEAAGQVRDVRLAAKWIERGSLMCHVRSNVFLAFHWNDRIARIGGPIS